jgi:chorismate mutase
MITATTPPGSASDSAPDSTSASTSGSALEEVIDIIPTLRTQIDAMDAAIIRLVGERVRLSKRIQAARINSGGTRVELGRERIVLDGYRAVLGPDGAQLGEAVLRVSRGAR